MFHYRSDYNIAYAATVKRMAATEGPLTEARLIGAHASALTQSAIERDFMSISPRHATVRAEGYDMHGHGGGDCMCWESACLNCGRAIQTGFEVCEVCWHFNGTTSNHVFIQFDAVSNPNAR